MHEREEHDASNDMSNGSFGFDGPERSEKPDKIPHEYESTKWRGAIDGYLKNLWQFELSGSPYTPEYYNLFNFTGWMMREGHGKTDDEVKSYMQSLYPHITEEEYKKLFDTVNKGVTGP